MKITYIHHSGFLVETDSCYYLFDYEKGSLPEMDVTKQTFVLSSHGHHDHYNAEIFSILNNYGMQNIFAILSDDIELPENVDVLQVAPRNEYHLDLGQTLTTFESTDEGVAFLIEDKGEIIYHAGDLNDWVWEEESDSYNEQMTKDYRKQIKLLSEKLNGREVDVAFVVLDPRQGKNGTYTGYLNYIYQTIYNILQHNDLILDKEQVGKIINSILETLSFEKQLIGEKIAGLELLICLYFEYGSDVVGNDVIEQLVSNKELFLKGYSMGIGAKDDTPTISFVYELCLKIMEVHQELNWLDYIMSFSQADNYYILRTLKIIEKVLVKGKDKIEDDLFIKTMMYFSIMMSKHKERDIKFYAVKCLIALSNYEKCNEAIVIQLSKIMDSSIAEIKTTIVSRINKIHNISREYRDYILQKAKVDNNYLVRKIALREIKKITV